MERVYQVQVTLECIEFVLLIAPLLKDLLEAFDSARMLIQRANLSEVFV